LPYSGIETIEAKKTMRGLFSSSKIKQLIIFIRLINEFLQLIPKPEILQNLSFKELATAIATSKI